VTFYFDVLDPYTLVVGFRAQEDPCPPVIILHVTALKVDGFPNLSIYTGGIEILLWHDKAQVLKLHWSI
jgi:hypothetical protein